MVFVLLLLGLSAIAAGVLGLGAALPMKDTTFGAAALVSSSIAAIGGLILLGMAVAVAELRRVLRAVMRPARQERSQERSEAGGRIHADQKSAARQEPRQEPRLAGAQPASGSVADVIPARFDTRAEDPRKVSRDAPSDARAAARPRKSPEVTEPRFAEPPVVQPPETGLSPPAAPAPTVSREQPVSEPRFSEPAPPSPPGPASDLAPDLGFGPTVQVPADVPAAPQPEPAIADNRDTVRIRDRRNGSEAPATYTAPSSAAADAARPVRILKSGVISEVAYTLFSDGTIETNTPEGTLRFASIDEFRRHLETSG